MPTYESPNFLLNELPRKLDVSRLKVERKHETIPAQGEQVVQRNEAPTLSSKRQSYEASRRQSTYQLYLEREEAMRIVNREND